jgi:xanthine dehydrogenase small subunit
VCMGLSVALEDGQVADARVAFGGMAAVPKRARACEAALTDQAWTLDNVRAAAAALADDFSPITDMRGSARYRMEAARNLLLRAFVDAPRVRDAQAVAHA